MEPNQEDCCNTGCNPCILDIREEQLRKYNALTEKRELLNKINCISPISYTLFTLINITSISDDANLYTFKYKKRCRGDEVNEKDLCLKYEPGQHFMLRGCVKTKTDQFAKAYTPIPYEFDDDEKANKFKITFTVLIKLYEGGLMSQYLRKLKIGDETAWRGPYGEIPLNYNNKFTLFIAQGTGIAPIYAIIKEILNNEDCESILHLMYCCRNEKDIYLRPQIYDFQSYWNFKYEIFLSNKESEIKPRYNEIINKNKLEKTALIEYVKDKKREEIKVLICGSETFSECIKQILLNKQLNIPECNLFIF